MAINPVFFSQVVCDIYCNYIFTVQVLQEFLMLRCTPKFVYLWKDAFVGRVHRNIRQDCSKTPHQASGVPSYKYVPIIMS